MLHQDVLEISYRHYYEIRRVFKEIYGLDGIEHFSLDLVRPDNEMVFLSSTPSHAYEICKRGYGQYDGIISPEYYQNFEFYWWKNAAHKAYSNKIEAIREGVLGLKHGFMLVRNWNGFYLIYSFATKKSDMHFQTTVINKINTFLKVGDWAYEELRGLYSNYTGQYEPPKIERFYSFEGGRPPPRYTTDFYQNNSHTHTKQNKIIYLDFKVQKR